MTDFRFLINLNGYVSQQWWRVAVVPSNKTLKANEIVSLRDAVEQYTRSEKSIKNFVCQKQLLGWNFQELRDKIKSIVYSTGYRSHVIVVSRSNSGDHFSEHILRFSLVVHGEEQSNSRSFVVETQSIF